MSKQPTIPTLPIDLYCHSYKGEPPPFKLEVYPESLTRLMDDAHHGLRIYELFSIRRPGEIKKYLWVLIKDVPIRVGMLYGIAREKETTEYVKCDWPKNECPYDVWDTLFYSSWDNDPEDNAWLGFKHSDIIHDYLDHCFAEIKKVQQLLKEKGDLLIKNEITHIENLSHSHDYEARTPFNLTKRSAPATVWEQHDEHFYQVLAELLTKPDIHSVAYRYGEDYRALRMLCNEQLHRVRISGETARDVFAINVLSDTLHNLEPWGCDVTFYDEGLGSGDLFIDPTNGAGCSVKELCEKYGNNSKYLLTVQDFGEIQRYTQEQRGNLFLYSRLISSTANGKDS